MTFLFVLLTLAVAIGFELIRRGRQKQVTEGPVVVTEYPSSFEVIDRYFHPGHTWVEVTGPKRVRVGIDDFSSRIMGAVEEIQLPAVGQSVRQGDTFVVLRHGLRKLPQVAPVSGKVAEVNRKLIKNPRLLNTAPLERGWVAKIVPTNLSLDLRNLLNGFAADGWRDAIRAQLIQLLSPSPGSVMQDGGQLVENLGEWLSDDQWNHLVHQFYPGIVSNQPQNKTQN
jgi:glycine cleavage system H lipoate-binding protein